MLTVGIVLCYLLGLSLLFCFSRRYSLLELVGYSFLLGIGLESIFLFLLDVVGVKYSQGILIGLNVAAMLAVNGANFRSLVELKNELKAPDLSLKNINLVAVFLFWIIGYLFYAITVKNLFWPATEHDTIGSFDKLGRIMAIEGKLKISLFDYKLEGAGGVYPPLFHASLAYVYLFGALTGKIVTTLFFLSLLTTFYSLVKNYSGSTAAAFFTLCLMVTPELFSHAALGLGNLPTTAYVGAAALATITWIEKRDRKFFWLGAVLMAFVIWIRSDTVVFIIAALAIVGVDFLRNKKWKDLLIYSSITVSPFVIWNLYLKLKIHAAQDGRFDLGIGYNSERVDLMSSYISAFLFGGQHGNIDGGQLYGLVFVLFFLLVFFNIVWIAKDGVKKVLLDNLYILTYFFVAFVFYSSVFYLINEKTQNAPISSLMESSFKRGLFCFVPLAFFYIAASPVSLFLFSKLEKFRKG
jgi:hypothetical protein